jgi:undecaprenyl-diphosphatase
MSAPALRSRLTDLDDRTYRRFRSVLHDRRRAERVIIGVTRAQNLWAIAGVVALAADGDRRRAWTRAEAVLGAAWAAAKLVSLTVRRPRPNLCGCPPARRKADGQSFPSTHVTVASAAAVALPPLLPRTALIAVATGTAIGRLLLGEHYPSDVAAGAILGTAVAAPYGR